MNRAAAINAARVGAQKIWAGTVSIHANAKTGAHHHGALESVIYVVRGKAMEFESTSLRVEKVVGAKSEGVINVRALKPGRYEFYDDFNEKARGALNVQ
jgi:uncharacterized RmlC-like cupin family protein